MTSLSPATNSADAPSNRYEIRAGSRLHLGLVEIHPGTNSCYGGIGWMVTDPYSTLRFEIAECHIDELQVVAPNEWQGRVLELCRRWLAIHPSRSHLPVRSLWLATTQRPHQGLGSGTQWSCMVIHALMAAASGDPMGCRLSIEELARLSGRGLRSYIGLAGYLAGGVILDYGLPSRSVRLLPFPNWPVLLLRDRNTEGESGDAEKEMFQVCSQHPNAGRGAMLSLIEEHLVPALESNDWTRWDHHIGQYGQLAGKVFEKVQGGVYRSQSIQRIIETAKGLGYRGAAQSSWGPSVALALPEGAAAESIIDAFQRRLPGISITLTGGRNSGSHVSPWNDL
ncbi:hypothetical protein VN12_20990 [Pirellula sp. SH-Sr6A]|nr:hypothetical protein VN12_20990 [Pirellula sp. SH-Sr6A]